jgi:hypothetical protein
MWLCVCGRGAEAVQGGVCGNGESGNTRVKPVEQSQADRQEGGVCAWQRVDTESANRGCKGISSKPRMATASGSVYVAVCM